jgi:hypothetical protein
VLAHYHGLQKGNPAPSYPVTTSIPDELNAFYARLEPSNTEPCMRAVSDNCVIMLSVADVRPLNRSQGQRDYQDTYSEHALPSSDFTNIFNLSLTQSVIPTSGIIN